MNSELATVDLLAVRVQSMGMLALKQLYRMSLGKPRLLSRCKTTASHKPTVAVAMSGGIDSAVTALLLQDQGYNCVGVFMKNWDPSDECGSEACDISVDYKDMQEVCKRLDIPSHEVSFAKFNIVCIVLYYCTYIGLIDTYPLYMPTAGKLREGVLERSVRTVP